MPSPEGGPRPEGEMSEDKGRSGEKKGKKDSADSESRRRMREDSRRKERKDENRITRIDADEGELE